MRAESLLALVAVLAAASAGAADDATLIVANGKVIVGDGTVLERGTVVVAGDRILAVRADPVDAAAAKLIDATGKTVMPGLIDAHVHLTMEKLFEQPRDDEAMESFVAGGLPERLRGFLEAGITTVMSPGDYWPAAVGVRDAVSTGELAGPRIRTAGRLLTAPGGHPAATFCGSLDMKGPNPWCREHLTEEVATEGEAREAVARLAGEGVDLVKFVYEDLGEPGVEPLAGELVDDIIAAAHGHELRAYAHSLEVAKAIQAIEEGLDGLVHVPAVAVEPDERGRLASLMVSEGIAAATTLTTFDSLIELLASQESQEEVTALRGLYDEMEMSLARLAEEDAGLLVLGTDSPHLPPGAAYHREIELVSEAGMTPGQIVMAATRDAARYMGLGDELGTVELGKLADLIVVEGDPLQDPSALREVVVVIKGGEIVAGGGE